MAELGGEAPAKFSTYAYPLLKFSRENKFGIRRRPGLSAGSGCYPGGCGGARAHDRFYFSGVGERADRHGACEVDVRARRSAGSAAKNCGCCLPGYNGTRNTGSDVRVNEMLRQIRHVLGAENVDFSVMTQDFGRTKGYFEGTRQVHLPDMFPPFLYREVQKKSRRDRLRRLDVQKQIRQRADHHDDRLAGAGLRGK